MPEHLDRRADVHLAVVGRDHQGRAGRQRLEQVGHEAVGRAQLGVVVFVQAAGVRHAIHPVVVGVDEALAALRSSRRTSTTKPAAVCQPWRSSRPRCAAENPSVA